jgi:hypothetical protein
MIGRALFNLGKISNNAKKKPLQSSAAGRASASTSAVNN